MANETLKDLLGALHAERLRTWSSEQLKLNIDQREELVAAADPTSWPQVGDFAPHFVLDEVDGARLDLATLTATGPAVLVFFRFATCPACNIALPYYDRTLAPALRDLGARLVAVSPQIPDRLGDIKARHRLSFDVATDRDAFLSRKFGLLFTANEASQAASRASGSFIGDVTGTGTWELPQPAVIVIGQDQRFKFVDVSPDWLTRTEPGPIIAAMRALAAVPAE
ncbi:peroxiredoxin-like family protein [Phenylobacterium immobile]|uniref:peroxiredoxin-like family protein n=1 Tax=Phenylobacterium immobile TaxID=21 RepID=UPI000A84F0C5|nr:peroxiredoxin-like family protein [Phenylobacterium immobile]